MLVRCGLCWRELDDSDEWSGDADFEGGAEDGEVDEDIGGDEVGGGTDGDEEEAEEGPAMGMMAISETEMWTMRW